MSPHAVPRRATFHNHQPVAEVHPVSNDLAVIHIWHIGPKSLLTLGSEVIAGYSGPHPEYCMCYLYSRQFGSESSLGQDRFAFCGEGDGIVVDSAFPSSAGIRVRGNLSLNFVEAIQIRGY